MTYTEDILRAAGLSLSRLTRIAALFEAQTGYFRYKISKRRGGTRTITQATAETSSVLKQLRIAMERAEFYSAPACVHGYVNDRGIRSNATQHLSQDVVLGADLLDFFPSITTAMIEASLAAHGLDGDGAQAIARATTINGQLPIGLSTSPFLSNVVFLPADLDLSAFAARVGVTYTRYADDLTLSGTFGDEVLDGLGFALSEHGWQLNQGKTRFMRRGGPQYVTGLYVGNSDRPHVPRRIKRRLRQRLHYMERFGIANVHQRGRDETMYENQAAGWISYVRQFEPIQAGRLQSAFDNIDFSDDYLYWGDPDDWSDLLDQI